MYVFCSQSFGTPCKTGECMHGVAKQSKGCRSLMWHKMLVLFAPSASIFSLLQPDDFWQWCPSPWCGSHFWCYRWSVTHGNHRIRFPKTCPKNTKCAQPKTFVAGLHMRTAGGGRGLSFEGPSFQSHLRAVSSAKEWKGLMQGDNLQHLRVHRVGDSSRRHAAGRQRTSNGFTTLRI